jgi:hypothetical protein
MFRIRENGQSDEDISFKLPLLLANSLITESKFRPGGRGEEGGGGYIYRDSKYASGKYGRITRCR